MPEQEPQKRIYNFDEVPLGYGPELAQNEASRCLGCKNPKCVAGCPVEIDIPGFISLVKAGEFAAAAQKVKEKNTLPAVCGRVCPQEEQCEVLCVLKKVDEPVAIGRLERFVADWEREHNLVTVPPKPPSTGKRVAIIGSGPAGLTCAADLAQMGHEVTIFEALHEAGGVLVYGIPEFRLPKAILREEVAYLEALGVEVKTSHVIGKILTLQELLEEGYDAIFVGTGAGLPKFMGIPGENLLGVYSANEFLTRANLMKAYLWPNYDTPIGRGQRVMVVGGGNVAMDSARTAKRLGATHVYIVYRRSRDEMPARIEEIHHAEEEGIEFLILHNPVQYLGDEKGALRAVVLQKQELGEPDDSGRRSPVPIEGSEFELEVEVSVVAIGAGANPLISSTTPDLGINKRGYIITDEETGATNIPGVYAGGDIVTGAATVILAMGAGRKAANAINGYLGSKG
jgi:glutamate synthase (NADPH/NADH) small chain